MTKKVKLDEIIENPEQNLQPVKESKIHKYFLSKMTEEERKEWLAKAGQARRAHWEKKRQKDAELKEKARELMPHVIAHELAQQELDQENFRPSQEMINKFRLVLGKDMPNDEVRRRYFPQVKDETWIKILKYVYNPQVSNIDTIGADIVKSKAWMIRTLKARIKEYKKDIKLFKKANPDRAVPGTLRSGKENAENKLFEIEQDIGKTLHQIGAVGGSAKAPNVTINLKTPRPKLEKQVVVVEPENAD